MLSPTRSAPDTTTPPRRFLIAAGTARYDHLADNAQLPGVEEDVRLVSALFTESWAGYEWVLPELGDSPTSDQLRKRLSGWLTAPERSSEDVVVFYYAGHGDAGPRKHRLLAADSQEDNLPGTTFSAEEIADMFAESKVRQALIILDTCYAGRGAGEFSAILANLMQPFAPSALGSGFYTLAAAGAREEALERQFARALDTVIRNPYANHAGERQPYLSPDYVVGAVNDWLASNRVPQTAKLNAAQVEGIPCLIPNVRYLAELPAGIDLEMQGHIARRYRKERVEHWDPRVWYFTGRVNALRELVAWLSAPPDGRARVVTGDPGSGKSAVLARLVTLADPEVRERLSPASVPPETLPPEGAVQIAIHARQKTLSELVAILAAETGVEENEPVLLVQALRGRTEPVTILVDALDEATDWTGIARQLLAPLTMLRSARLLIGTRRECLASLGPAGVTLDLDRDPYRSEGDVAAYVAYRLRAEEEPDVPTPYRDLPNIQEIADAVARRAEHNFLVARLIADSLRYAAEAVDTHRNGWMAAFPSTVEAAFDEYLDRFEAERERVRDLLQPLAYAQGAGLPWEDLWARLASALSGRLYTDGDIQWLFKRAGAYLVESAEGSRSVYRLYHQALADSLQRRGQEREMHRRFVETLTATVPALQEGGRKDWTRAHPYVLTYLASHAARAGEVESLLSDPLYLICADPTRLYLAVQGCRKEEAALYRGSIHLMQHAQSPAERASYLEMRARQQGYLSLADRLALLPLPRRWSVSWARWIPASEHRLLVRHTDEVDPMVLGELDGQPVVVSGADDGTIRVWDLATGEPVGKPMKGHTSSVCSVALGELNGRPVVVSGGRDSTVRVLDMATGEPVGKPFKGHTEMVRSVALGELDGRPVVVSGSNDNTVRIWDLVGGKPVGKPMKGHTGVVFSVALGELNGRSVIVSGSRDNTVRIWDLATGKPVGKPMRGHTSAVYSVATGELNGRPVVISGSGDDTIRVWDLSASEPVGEPLQGHSHFVYSVAVGQLDDRSVIVSGSHDSTIRVWDLATGEPIGDPLQGHARDVRCVAVGQLDDRSVIVSCGEDKTIRVWDFAIQAPAGEPLQGHTDGVTCVAVGELAGRSVIVTGSYDSTIRVWDLATGEPVGEPLEGHYRMIFSVAVGDLDGRSVIVSSGADWTIRVWDLITGEAIGEPMGGDDGNVSSVVVGELAGRSVIVSCGEDETVRLWDLATGEPIGGPLEGHTSWVNSVAIGELDGRSVIVSGGDRTVRIWDLATGEPIGEPLQGSEGVVSPVAVGELAGRSVIVSADDATVRMWDLATRGPAGKPLNGHSNVVLTVAAGRLDGHSVVVSGSWDETVRVWDLQTSNVLSCDVGTPVTAVCIAAADAIVVGTDRGHLLIRLLGPVEDTT